VPREKLRGPPRGSRQSGPEEATTGRAVQRAVCPVFFSCLLAGFGAPLSQVSEWPASPRSSAVPHGVGPSGVETYSDATGGVWRGGRDGPGEEKAAGMSDDGAG
jgi:hypothetical protein